MFAPLREIRLGSFDLVLEREPDGSVRARSPHPLGAYPERLTEALEHWAAAAPERVFLAKRDPDGAWRELSYRETLRQVRRIGQALLDRDLSAERPLAILSGNDLEHALLTLAGLHVGVPVAPISPAYALLSKDFGKLRDIIGLITPGMVFAAEGADYEAAIRASVPPDVELVVVAEPPAGRGATIFADLLACEPRGVDAAAREIGPDTIAKFLFTSGSTGAPKAVINTQRMLCSNQAMLQQMLAFVVDEPPIMLDWLPWHHTAGGNHNFGLVLFNGGSLYIDDGRPTPAGFEETVRNLRELPTTFYVNVPKGFETLLPWLERDPVLCENFFSRLRLMFYAGANLAQHVWQELQRHAIEATGERILMLTGYGATETAPFAFMPGKQMSRAGEIGLPAPGSELKLVPLGDGRYDARLRGPHITPGYWRQPAETATAFDDEGFYRLGDAVRFLDPKTPHGGFLFDGRLGEDFKLSTGTWVHVGEIRRALIGGFAPLLRDAVIAGHDRDEVTALLVPDLEACRHFLSDSAACDAEILRRPALRHALQKRLDRLAEQATGSSNHVARAVLLVEPLSLDAHEVTDKGSINQRAVLEQRARLVEELYAVPYSPQVLVAETAEVPSAHGFR
jgi:feruloyl-CoA synthase